ncbi:sugar phosphate nucleotidyltransferase [Mycoplasma simbae]|uniref:sugar phosphate nucleotidyltransferase n=1 Tax=Mycoplasma simbae TaxID=36744 RepID=UPI000498355F|nr:sugar phosphate nucleotidyltransferase [Mycoplasma simbae]
MNKIKKNAIILAAGFGSRLVPLTFKTPKGLVKIKDGHSMIERQIIFLKQNGIDEIHIVVGYKAECFNEIANKYNVNLIFNPDFDKSNSFISLYKAKEYLQNTYILNSDAWINSNFFNALNEKSFMTIIQNKSKSRNVYEWRTKFDENGKITELKPCNLIENDFYITGPVYFDHQTSIKYLDLAEQMFKDESLAQNSYWEQPIFELLQKTDIYINNQTNNVFEIDNLNDIKFVDSHEQSIVENECFTEICQLFHCKINDIKHVSSIKKGLTNNSFSFVLNDTKYVYRSAGEGTENIVDRDREQKVYSLIQSFEHAERIYHYNPVTYSKITYFETGSKNIDAYNFSQVKKCMSMIKKFHAKKYKLGQEFNIAQEINKYTKQVNKSLNLLLNEYIITEKINKIFTFVEKLKVDKFLSHIDFIPDNLLINQDGFVTLIDYEYAGDCDQLIDIAAFATSAFYNKDDLDKIIGYYFNQRQASRLKFIRIYAYMALLGYLWWIWTLAFIDKGNSIDTEYSQHMLNNAKFYTNLLENEYEEVFK